MQAGLKVRYDVEHFPEYLCHEAIFGFSIALLQKNEETLLKLKFEQILNFIKNSILDCYTVRSSVAQTG